MKASVVIFCLVAIVVAEAAPSAIADDPKVDCSVPPRPESEEDWAVLVPNPSDCKSYYICNGAEAVWMPCPEGLHFNPVLAVCDWPSAANCNIGTYEGLSALK